MQVLVAGDAWVLTRMDGVLTAFDDHCPHWQSPLSAGSVTRADDGSPRLSCAFHGWRFDAMGQCDLMPGLDRGGHAHRGGHRGGHRHQDWQGKHGSRGGYTDRGRRGPGTRLLAAYGVAERYGLVWLAADEPLAPLPEFPEWEDDTAGRATCRSVTVHASAGQLIDGFLDTEADEVATGEWRVTGEWRAGNRDGGTGAPHRTVKTAGPHATARLRLELPYATIGVLVTCQPEDWGTTRVYKLITHSGLAGNAAAMEEFTRDENRVLTEYLSVADGCASPLLPLDPDGEAPSARAGQLNMAWRGLMARALMQPG